MIWQYIIAEVNATVCFLMMLRLLFFHLKGAPSPFFVKLFRFILVLASGSVAFRIWGNDYGAVDPSELILNIVLCIGLYLARGNLSEAVRRISDGN